MAHNSIRSAPEIQRAVRRAFGLGPEEEGLERVGETLDVSADFWGPVEWRFLRGERALGRQTTSVAVAAQQSYVLFNNPLTSNLIAVVDRFRCDQPHGAGIINSSAAIVTGGAVIGKGFSRDSRWSPYPLLIQASGALDVIGGAAAVPGVTQVWAGIANEVTDSPGIVVHPGYAFVVFGNAVNTQVTVAMHWRERRAFPGELP